MAGLGLSFVEGWCWGLGLCLSVRFTMEVEW